MSNTQGPKSLEAKVRPWQNPKERTDLKGVARVHLSSHALQDLGLKPEQTCYLLKAGEAPEKRRQAIVWYSHENSMRKNVVQLSKTFQDVCDLKLGDDIKIIASGNLAAAESIILKDVTAQEDNNKVLPELDRPVWESYIADSLWLAQEVFPGMTLTISRRANKRAFLVESINGSTTNMGQFSDNSVVKIGDEPTLEPEQIGVTRRMEVVDIAGIDQALTKLNRFLSRFGRKYIHTAPKSCAALLHGGPGTGKSFIMNKIASTGWGKVYEIDSNVKPAAIKTTFDDARLSQPSIIIIDELESIVSRDDSISHDNAKALGKELDNLVRDQKSNILPRILVIAATLDAGRIPISLKKRGRFTTDILLPLPDATARKLILKSLDFPLPSTVREETLDKLGDRTHAYSAQDLVLLQDAVNEYFEDRAEVNGWDGTEEGCHLIQDDIERALLAIRPTAMHDITLQPPKVRWAEIGGQEGVKNELREAVETPLLHPELMKRVGASAKKGLLMYGPPGCSKTLSAQAMATEIGFNFFAVKGAELLNMYVGESERQVREVFARARAASPSIIFFDEIESIGSKREGGRNNGVNVLTTLLNEMDGIETLKGVMVLAATNKPQVLDLALLRPGRFDKLLYVAPPDLTGREEILKIRTRKMDVANDVDIVELAVLTDGYSGAELVSICSEACDAVIRKCRETNLDLQVHMEDIIKATRVVKRQITPELVKGYEQWAAGIRGDTD